MTIEWHIEKRKISDLKDYYKNPRTLTKEQEEHLKLSLSKFGLIDKPIINIDNTIIGGHQRKRTLKKMGIKEIECNVPNRQLEPKEVEELNIRLNKNTGDWDYDILANQWEIPDLIQWGFKTEDFDIEIDLDAQEDCSEILEPKKEEDAITKLGDLYELNEHRLICGSSTDILKVEKLLNGIWIDLVITDPPYNVNYVGKTKNALKIQNDSMSNENFYQFLYDAFVNTFSLCKKGASIYVFHSVMEGINFIKAFTDAGFKLSQCLIWLKNHLVLGRNDYHWKHEPILYGWKEGEAHNWYSDRSQTTVLEFDKPQKSEEHPTMKPISIIAYLMNNSSKKDDYVFDPFLGSGTTLIAAEQLNRKCFGIELSPAYCDIIVNRYKNYMVKNNKEFIIKKNGEIQDGSNERNQTSSRNEIG